MRVLACVLAVACLLAGVAPVSAPAQSRQTSWATYSTLAHAQAVAIAEALRASAGLDLKIQSADTDLAGVDLLRAGRVDFSATAIGGSVAAQEGVFEFAAKGWGPQKVRLVLANSADTLNYNLIAAGDLGVRTYADLKGRRVAWYMDFPVVNVNTEAFLAYGGLTWADVERVEIRGFFDAAFKALANGQLDAAFAATIGEDFQAAAASPRGLYWPPVDRTDTAAMGRLLAVAPYFVPHAAAHGTADAGDKSHHGAHYPYPILVTMRDTDAGLVRAMMQALVEARPHYRGKVIGIDGWRIDEQYLRWFVPYHDGAIAWLREQGLWTAAAQAHNDALIARQEALAAAWQALAAENPQDWTRAWNERRRRALRENGFRIVF